MSEHESLCTEFFVKLSHIPTWQVGEEISLVQHHVPRESFRPHFVDKHEGFVCVAYPERLDQPSVLFDLLEPPVTDPEYKALEGFGMRAWLDTGNSAALPSQTEYLTARCSAGHHPKVVHDLAAANLDQRVSIQVLKKYSKRVGKL